MTAQIIETRYTLPHGEVAALEIGSSKTTEQSVVFLHGWLDNAASFLSVMQAMHYQHPSLHLVALDFFGHGHSDHKSSDNFYPFHDYIADFHYFLSVISANRPVIVGHSLGALVASCYSSAFPENVAALVQIEGFMPISEASEKVVERLRNGVVSRQRLMGRPLRLLKHKSQALAMRSKATNLPEALIAPIVERDLETTEQGVYWRHDPKLKCDSLYRMTIESAQQFVSQIACPHTLILGSHGYRQLHSDMQAKDLKESMNSVIVAGGHHCHLEQPQQVAEQILDIVNKI